MNIELETLTQKPDRALYERVIGIVKYRHQLRSLHESLAILGVRKVEDLNGPGGIQRLETLTETLSQDFYGALESEMLQCYFDALADDHMVFVAFVVPEFAEKTARIANIQGASEVVHFGNSAVTNY